MEPPESNLQATVPSGYAAEICGLCKGAGKGALGWNVPCPPCAGSGKVLVLQPPLRCPRCKGDGRPKGTDGLFYHSDLCVICRGAGWVMTWNP